MGEEYADGTACGQAAQTGMLGRGHARTGRNGNGRKDQATAAGYADLWAHSLGRAGSDVRIACATSSGDHSSRAGGWSDSSVRPFYGLERSVPGWRAKVG